MKKIVDGFHDGYWSDASEKHRFPHEFHKAMADAGWLGITMPEELGGAGLGVTEPDAGLDTTSINTFAKKVNGGYRVTGLLLTRTTPKAECKKPTDGLTLFNTDLDESQIEVTNIPKKGPRLL